MKANWTGGVLLAGATTLINFQVNTDAEGSVIPRASKFSLAKQNADKSFTWYRGTIESAQFEAGSVQVAGFAGAHAAVIVLSEDAGDFALSAQLFSPDGAAVINVPSSPAYGGGSVGAFVDSPQVPA